jgi:hypothetical protein
MARSDYIYILQCIEGGEILAAKTVKSEMVVYINHCGTCRAIIEDACRLIRFSDGGAPPSEPFFYDWKDIP